MSKRIVIIPSFASSHFLKCWIPNMIETLNPDVIIINESIFPNGPENKGYANLEEFRKKWFYKDTNAGFDFGETLDVACEYTLRKFDGDISIPHIEVRNIKYKSGDANECFLQAITDPLDSFASVGDIIFPLEPDAFIFESDSEIIQEEISRLKPGEGLSCKWVDFLETQYYTEAINLIQPKYRRFCYCFDNMQNYKAAMSGFMSQNYPLLKKTDSFFIRHYCWFQPEPWKQLRYELIWRKDPQYWQDFERGLRGIREMSQQLVDEYKSGDIPVIHPRELLAGNGSIEIRPSRSDEGRFAQFIDVDQPAAIKNHRNFVK